MNGWQRLFAVFSAAVAILAGSLWLMNKPSGIEYISGCDQPAYATQSQAEVALRNKAYTQTPFHDLDCRQSLVRVANGHERKESIDRWHNEFWSGAALVAVFLAAVYALGAALGWVWRGFFPKKNASA